MTPASISSGYTQQMLVHKSAEEKIDNGIGLISFHGELSGWYGWKKLPIFIDNLIEGLDRGRQFRLNRIL